MSKRIILLAAAATVALAFAGLAQAHVTIHPNALPSGGYTVINVRVPNERPTTITTKVDVSFPTGFYSVSYQSLPGWKAQIVYRKLAKPITVNGQSQSQEVDQVIFTGKLPPHQFTEFPLSVAVPSVKAGTILTFKALQTYSNGEIVRWIGPPGADTPAPQVKVIDANSPVADYPGGVSAVKMKMTTRLTQAATSSDGLFLAGPVAALTGVGVARKRRKKS